MCSIKLPYTPKHRSECKNPDDNQYDTDGYNRRMPTITNSGNRSVFVAPEITDAPPVLLERNDQSDYAGAN